ncbi:MAG: helix-hairpin-helix DNA-binding class 1, partial [bacterium]
MPRFARPLAVILPAAAILLAFFPAPRANAAFEALEVDPRARAMGGAATGVDLGWLSAWHNPAALSAREDLDFGVTTVQPHSESFVKLRSAGLSGKLPGKLGGIALGFRRLATEFQDQSLDEQNTVTLAHGFQLNEDVSTAVSIGYALNLYSQNFGPSINSVDPGSATTVGLDLSARVTVRNRTSVGFIARNINNPTLGDQDVEDLPRRVTGGIAYYPYPDVLTTFDIDSELGEKPRMRGGAEFQFVEWLAIRTGIATDPGLYTAGLGVNWKGFRLDYGFSTGPGPLDDSHQVGL